MTKKEIKIKQREDEQGGVSASLGKQPLRSLKNRLADKNGLYIMFSDSKLEYLFNIQISLDFQLSDMFKRALRRWLHCEYVNGLKLCSWQAHRFTSFWGFGRYTTNVLIFQSIRN